MTMRRTCGSRLRRGRLILLRALWLALAVFPLALPEYAMAQRSSVVEGRVIVGGRPRGNVAVRLQDHTFTILDVAFSDATGLFRFRQISGENPGGLFLVVEEDGFERASVRLDLRQLQGPFAIYLEPEAARVSDGGQDGDLLVDLQQLATVIPDQPAFLTGFRREVSETPSELRRVPRAGRVAARSSRRIKRSCPQAGCLHWEYSALALADGSGAVADNS